MAGVAPSVAVGGAAARKRTRSSVRLVPMSKQKGHVDVQKKVVGPTLPEAVAGCLGTRSSADEWQLFKHGDGSVACNLVHGTRFPVQFTFGAWGSIDRASAAAWADRVAACCGDAADEHESMVPRVHNVLVEAALGFSAKGDAGNCVYVEFFDAKPLAIIIMNIELTRGRWTCTLLALLRIPPREMVRRHGTAGECSGFHEVILRLVSLLAGLGEPDMIVRVNDVACMRNHRGLYERSGFEGDERCLFRAVG